MDTKTVARIPARCMAKSGALLWYKKLLAGITCIIKTILTVPDGAWSCYRHLRFHGNCSAAGIRA